MKNCKICNTNAVVKSEVIDGLYCCKMCGNFYFEGKVDDCKELSVGQILREEINLSGFNDTIFTTDAIHLIAQIKSISANVIDGFISILESGADAIQLIRNGYELSKRQGICDVIEKHTNLSPRLIFFFIDSYAYGLSLSDQIVHYADNASITDSLKILKFQAEMESIKSGEDAKLHWEVSDKDAIVAISDGFHQWNVPATGSMIVKPLKNKQYTITAVKGNNIANPEIVKIKIVKPVNISSFKVSKSKAYEGQSVTVSWKTTGATHVELLVNDGFEYRKAVNVTGLKQKEIRVARDCQIILTCYNDCYQCQETLNVHVNGAPRFPVQQLSCLRHLPEINIGNPIIPTSLGHDPVMKEAFLNLEKSRNSLKNKLLNRLSEAFNELKYKI